MVQWDNWAAWGREALHILVILLVAWAASRLLRRFLVAVQDYALRRAPASSDAREVEKNIKTIQTVLGRGLSFLIWTGAILAVLRRIGIDTTPVLTGAGILGVAVGFGSQALVRDVISGLFLLLEGHIRVHDTVTINTVTGTVEELNLRTTVLRAENGSVHVFANGNITTLANLSRDFAHAVFEYTLEPTADAGRALDLLHDILTTLNAEDFYAPKIVEPPERGGIDRITDAGVVIKARVKVRPHEGGAVSREAHRRVLLRYQDAGIAFAGKGPAVNVRLDRA